MSGLARQRCYNHATREAAARCLGCQRDYCRECVSEHEGRYLCARCIAAEAAGADHGATDRLALGGLVAFVAGVCVLWFVFMIYGRLVYAIPSEFHFLEQGNDATYYEGETGHAADGVTNGQAP